MKHITSQKIDIIPDYLNLFSCASHTSHVIYTATLTPLHTYRFDPVAPRPVRVTRARKKKG